MMKIARYLSAARQPALGLVDNDRILPLNLSAGQYRTLSDILEEADPAATARMLVDSKAQPLPLADVQLLPPIEQQEVWAAGVTYKRSRTARMEESTTAASVYDLVYEADRPELFFKATPSRVSGPGQPLRIRRDATWNVPEPELALVLSRRLKLVGYTIGNDMSSRDIEGANPLYLPQAKVYDQCCGLGPWITLGGMPPRSSIGIRLQVQRGGSVVFEGQTDVGQMARPLENLIEYLGRDNTMRHGAFLLTGTGVVPPGDFTLAAGDVVSITIDGIGTLTNPVVCG